MLKFHCYNPDESDPAESDVVEGYNAQQAAELFAEDRDADGGEGYSDTQIVCVREDSEKTFRKFRVAAEPSVNYTATEEQG